MWGQFENYRYRGKLYIASCIPLNPEVKYDIASGMFSK